ncbi:hypothetical protein PM8797T_08704 [Gimesia maris DSM 8797]|uniref:DUF1559 domain-containing protein n=2 Tax=Gimesia maris TaxID=122 RepID=A0ABX5YF10_9PLAN|nr:hypothetical protein PM8797T_08704 [Gimesia maris DSM 8797]QEG14283.1 hypothetical protein GmarT_01160 [Gimesia maris]
MENKTVEPKNRKRKRFAVLLVSCFILVFFLGCAGISFPSQFLFYMFQGWLMFLQRVIPQVIVPASGLVTALVVVSIMALLIQLLGRFVLHRLQQQHTIPVPNQWKVRWTISLIVFLVISFTGGFAVVGIAHQGLWLFTAPEGVIGKSSGPREASFRISSRNRLRNIGLAVVNYSSGDVDPLPTGIYNSTGQPLHSWQTQILPFMDQVELYKKIDLAEPWNTEKNAPHFKTHIPAYTIDSRDTFETNLPDYGVSEYSLNSRVFYPASRLKYDQIPDGIASTIMAGEIVSRLPAWGNPANLRDPALGINRHPQGFGGPWKRREGANMLFMDGSGRFINQNIDPGVLEALSTPDGGETVGEY